MILQAVIAQAAQLPPETVQAAGSSLVKDTALGAFAVICLSLMLWAIKELKKVQDERINDKEKLAEKLEASNEKDRAQQKEIAAAVAQLANAQQESNRALERHTQVISQVIERQTSVIERQSAAIDGIIRDAVGIRRRTGISSGSMPAVRQPSNPIIRRDDE